MAQEIINAAPVDAVKKSKKDNKNKKIEANGNGEAVAESSSKKEKKDKKDKKRKREEKFTEDADEDEEDKADPSLLRAAPVSTTEEQVNGNGEEKKEKKSKKRKLDGEGGAGEELNGDGEERKKKKKDKKEKKDKKANGGEVAETAAPAVANEDVEMKDVSADAPVEKSEKKDKKKDKKDKKAKKENGATPATASSSNITLTGTASPEVTKSYLEKHNITLTPSIYNILNSFASLPINPAFHPYLSSFKEPTPIQACSWPPLFEGKDVVGIAETGSGKTLAFGLPGLNALSTTENPTTGKQSKSRGGKDTGKIRLLVVAPTRELATQTFQTLEALGKLVGITAVCLYGGVGKEEQLRDLRKENCRIVVGTPGRVMDLADSGDVDFSRVQYLVLDEADRMLDQGFENDIRKIIGYCPTREAGRQTVMFSATWPESVRRLASTFLSEPVKITVGSDELSANKRIEQIVEVLDDGRGKEAKLMNHLRQAVKNHPKNSPVPARILVFALYKKEATRLENSIRYNKFSVAGLHGDLSQDARFKALNAFRDGQVNILVATDVAARGLDIPDVQLVINVTFPLTTEDFVHRCGRTGRAGKSGKAITFFTGEAHEKSLAGEFMRVLRDAGATIPAEMDRFPTTIKKKEHGSYGAFYRDISDAPAPKKITFD